MPPGKWTQWVRGKRDLLDIVEYFLCLKIKMYNFNNSAQHADILSMS